MAKAPHNLRSLLRDASQDGRGDFRVARKDGKGEDEEFAVEEGFKSAGTLNGQGKQRYLRESSSAGGSPLSMALKVMVAVSRPLQTPKASDVLEEVGEEDKCGS
jgi:hypothetical protein